MWKRAIYLPQKWQESAMKKEGSLNHQNARQRRQKKSTPKDTSRIKKNIRKINPTCSGKKQYRYLSKISFHSSVSHTLNNKQNTYTTHVAKITNPYFHYNNVQFAYTNKEPEYFEHSKLRKNRKIRIGQRKKTRKKRKRKKVNILWSKQKTKQNKMKTDCEF